MKRFSGVGQGDAVGLPVEAVVQDLCETRGALDKLVVEMRSVVNLLEGIGATLEEILEETEGSREELVDVGKELQEVGRSLTERLAAQDDEAD